MAEDKKTTEVTDAGAVELNESDLDQASGGTSFTLIVVVSPGLKASPRVPVGYDLKTAQKV